MGQLKESHSLKEARRNIARIKTEINAKMAARTLQGTVTSQKMNKTITVVVARRTKHPKYGKYINLSTKYHVHDEKEISKEGDIVLIQECKPISKTKNWMLVNVVKKGESE